MSEAEIVGAIQGAMGVIHSNREFALTILTGYLLIIHFVGKDLTRFQIMFASAVYSLFYLHRVMENYGTGVVQESYRQMLVEQFPDFAEKLNISRHSNLTNEIELALSLLIFFGSLIFMWSVRHPPR